MPELLVVKEIWLNFQQLVSTFQQLMLPELPPTKLQITTMYTEITTYFDRQLLPLGEQELPAPIAGKMRSYITEIHRLLKVLQRDLIFWQSAQQTQNRAERRSAILAKLEAIMRFTQSMIGELTISIDL